MRLERGCVVIGGGPAGMAAAIALHRLGVRDLLILERNDRLGGILDQCIHVGFGLSWYGEDLTGPEYASRLAAQVADLGIETFLGTMVLDVARPRIIRAMSASRGLLEIEAAALVVATGCRERTRENLEIPGTRPAGVFTAGQAQNLVNSGGRRLGHKVIIQGSGDIGLIMARRLSIEGCEVAAVYERLPWLSGLIRNKVQCLDHFGIPLHFRTQISEITGRHRVEGVWVERLDEDLRPIPGTARYRDCDTVLFSVGLIPEVDILKGSGIAPGKGGAVEVNSSFETGEEGIFIAGNALHIHDLADKASQEGEAVAAHVASFLKAPREHRASTRSTPPYEPPEADRSKDETFFETLTRSGKVVCIVCPRGCLVSETEASCPRGAAYFRQSRLGFAQILTTTIKLPGAAGGRRLPLRSLDPVATGEIGEARAALARATARAEGTMAIKLGDREVRFRSCAREPGPPAR